MLLPRFIIKGEPLSDHTSLKMGGPAKYFMEAKKEQQLLDVVRLAKSQNIRFMVIGDGSNLLISRRGFDGLIIKNSVTSIKSEGKVITVKMGTKLQALVDYTIKKGLAGMQNLAGIPGTVGGAICGNAGAYGQTISDYLVRLKAFDGKKSLWFSKRECRFSYRESFIKNSHYVLLEAKFKVSDKQPQAMLKKQAEEILKARNNKYPKGIFCPGSFFKNFPIERIGKKKLNSIPPDKIVFGKLPAGYLLEAVGAKGAKRGKIKIADYHANLFINIGGGRPEDFYELAKLYKRKVAQKFGITLEPEVKLVGFSKAL